MGIFSTKSTKATETKVDQMTDAEFLAQEKKEKRKKGSDFSHNFTADDKLIQESIRASNAEYQKFEEDQRKKEQAIQRIFEDTFLKDIIGDFDTTTITDIKFNGTELRVQCNNRGRYVPEKQPTLGEVDSLVYRIANIQGFEFTDSEPILDTEIGGIRLSAMHHILSPEGATFAMRISKPTLAIQDMTKVAPKDVWGLLSTLVRGRINLIIAGETGSGKTELQKVLVGDIADHRNIILMEDTMDSHLKKLYPKKDINSWRTLTQENRQKKIHYRDLTKATLRNNPEWAIISETRSDDAYYVLQVALSGHSIMTTLHTDRAISIPYRIMEMITETRPNADTNVLGNNIVRYLPIGIHMKVEETPTGVERYISEIMEYTGYETGVVTGNTIYKLKKIYNPKTKQYEVKFATGEISVALAERLSDAGVIHELPERLLPKAFQVEGAVQ